MNDIIPNFDPVAVAAEIAALETEAQKDLAAAKAKYEPEAALFISRSEIIAAKLWDVEQNHPEHMDEVCRLAGIGRSRRYQLLEVGGGRKTIEQQRAENAAAQAKFKAKKKAEQLAAAEAAKAESITSSKVMDKAPAQPKASKSKGKPAPKPKPIKSSTALAEIKQFCQHWVPLLNKSDRRKAMTFLQKMFEQGEAP